jgi:hypothetical protein
VGVTALLLLLLLLLSPLVVLGVRRVILEIKCSCPRLKYGDRWWYSCTVVRDTLRWESVESVAVAVET